jgi:ABC-2 type transport system permease protein
MSRALLLLQKDVRVLLRSRVLLVALLVYPVLVAVLVGLVVRYAGERPSVAFVDEDNLPATLVVGGQRFHITKIIDQVSSEVNLVSLPRAEAERRLRNGEVAAVIVVPPGFASTLRGMVESPRLLLETPTGGLNTQIAERVQALVYNLNRKLQVAYIKANLQYVDMIRRGGQGTFLGNPIDVLGLERAALLLSDIEARVHDPVSRRQVAELQHFLDTAKLALGASGDSMRAVANPIELGTKRSAGRSWIFSAEVQAYALALTLAFLCILLAAASTASERDENVIGRLVRGLVRIGELVSEKVALVALVALVVGLALALAFAIAIEAGDVVGGEPWARLPVLAFGLALAGAAFGAVGVALGAVARETRTASLVAFLVVLPLVLLGLVPSGASALAGWVSDAFPFAHAARYFRSALYDTDPWGTLGRELAWLAGLAFVFGAAARVGVRKLLV